jgi:hypothetical protein
MSGELTHSPDRIDFSEYPDVPNTHREKINHAVKALDLPFDSFLIGRSPLYPQTCLYIRLDDLDMSVTVEKLELLDIADKIKINGSDTDSPFNAHIVITLLD